MSKEIKNKYIIIELNTMDYMKDKEGNLKFYDSIEDAYDICGMYEFEDVWICKALHNHKEPKQ